MRIFFLIITLSFVFLFAALHCIIARLSPIDSGIHLWTKIYFEQARIPMFTGFITLGSFLLTLQTALIQRLKDAFDNDEYKLDVMNLRLKEPKAPYYGSLERMSVALSTAVVVALTTAASQLSIGFVREPWSTAFCIALAGTCLGLVIFMTIELMRAHRHWFKKIEKEKATLTN